jgi:hypothetical protein
MLFNNAVPAHILIPPKRNAEETQIFEIFTTVKMKIILKRGSFYDAVGNSNCTASSYGKNVKVTLSAFRPRRHTESGGTAPLVLNLSTRRR